jgi:ribosomal protein S28E/S33
MRNAMRIIQVRRLVLVFEVASRVLTYNSAGPIRAASVAGSS